MQVAALQLLKQNGCNRHDKNKLAAMMSELSNDARLSRRYTNHCVRATCATELHSRGWSTFEIQGVTGHKSERSVSRYVKRVSDEQKWEVSKDLSISLRANQEIVKCAPSMPLATVNDDTKRSVAADESHRER